MELLGFIRAMAAATKLLLVPNMRSNWNKLERKFIIMTNRGRQNWQMGLFPILFWGFVY